MDIYADILFIENVTVNYILLKTTQKLTRGEFQNSRLFGGSIIGALGVFPYLFFSKMSIISALLFKVVLSIAIIFTAFKIKTIKQAISLLTAFYLSSFVFAGVLFAFMFSKPVIGERVYESLRMGEGRKWITLVLAAFALWILLYTFWGILRNRIVRDTMIIPLAICVEGKTIHINAFLDTGNLLSDPLTHDPVIVVELEAIKEILPKELYPMFVSSNSFNAMFLEELEKLFLWRKRLRIIPFQSLGNKDGVLVGFTPDFIRINFNKEEKDVVVAVYDQPLRKGGENNSYKAIIGPQWI